MFTLQTGSYRALEQAFLDDLLTQKKDPLANVLVLSPSGTLLNHLQARIAAAGAGFLNIHFLTFYALAERVLAESSPSAERVVGEPVLFREIINDFLEGRGEVPYASRNSLRRPGLPIPKGLSGALASTLKDLQDSGARVVDCANVAREGHLGEAAGHAVPILELNVLMYDVLRKRGLRAGADFIRRASERVPQSPWIKQQKAIYLYGFYDLTGVQLDLVLALAGHPRAQLYFPYEEGNPAYSYAEKLLKDPALTSKVSVTSPSPVRRMGEGGDEGKAVPSPWPSPMLRTGEGKVKVETHTCSGSTDEIWLAAKKILELADSGVPFHQMSLQARTLDPYLNVIRDVFETHRIPYALHAEEPVGAYPLMKAARQVLRGEAPEVSPYCRHPGEGRGPVALTSLDSGLRRNDDHTWSTHVSHAKTLLESGMHLPKNATVTEQRLWDGLFEAIDSLSQLDLLGKPVTAERFLEVLEEKLEGLRLPLQPDNIAGVQVMDVMTARGLSFDAVFLVGLNEKLFPRLIREDPFLSDHARSALSSALGSRLGRKMDGFQEERLLFQLATESANQHLHLSCQRSDEEGKALVVSLYMHDFMRKNGLEATALPRTWGEKLRQVPGDTLTPKEVSVAFHRESREPTVLYSRLGWNQALLAHLLRSQREVESFGALGPHDGLIGQDNPLAQTVLEAGLSPQTIKDLAECPFKVFSRKVLALYTDQGDVEDGQLTHTGRGKLIHKILQVFYQTHSELAALDRISEEEFKAFAAEKPEIYPLAWQAEKTRILTMLRRFIPQDLAEMKASGFTPKEFEIALTATMGPGPMEQRGAAVGQAPYKAVKVQGRIDRLDVREGPNAAYRVVDYKTGSGGIGKRETVENAIMRGKNFQLPVYLALAQTFLEAERPTSKPLAGEALFYRLEEEDATAEPLEIGPDFWKEHGERFYKNLAFLAKNIETGSFYIRPSDNRGYCEWCDYKTICRKEHKPTQIRSENSSLRRKHEETFTPPKS